MTVWHGFVAWDRLNHELMRILNNLNRIEIMKHLTYNEKVIQFG